MWNLSNANFGSLCHARGRHDVPGHIDGKRQIPSREVVSSRVGIPQQQNIERDLGNKNEQQATDNEAHNICVVNEAFQPCSL